MHYRIDINAVNKDGWSSLHRAASSKQIDVVTFLLDHGIDNGIKTKRGKTARELALSMRYYDVADFIKVYVKQKGGAYDFVSEKPEEGDSNNVKRKKQKEPLFFKEPVSGQSSKQSPGKKSGKSGVSGKTKERRGLFKAPWKTEGFSNLMRFRIPGTRKGNMSNDYSNLGERDQNECPVCFEVPLPPVHIYQCNNGHLYCGRCRSMPNMDRCPQCGISISGLENRNRYAEEKHRKNLQ